MKSGIEPAVRTVRPGDFPLGSAKSRAMARALCQEKKHKRHIVQVIHFGRDPNLQPELVTSLHLRGWPDLGGVGDILYS
jgi:hypothetical protein